MPRTCTLRGRIARGRQFSRRGAGLPLAAWRGRFRLRGVGHGPIGRYQLERWVLLYPKGVKASEIQYAATLRLPQGGSSARRSCRRVKASGVIHFEPVSLETLVDSPVVLGAYFRTVDLRRAASRRTSCTSWPTARRPGDETRGWPGTVAPGGRDGALFGARHYRAYHFLLTLSDHVAHFGLEHHRVERQPAGREVSH